MGIKLADAVTYLTADSRELDRELGKSESKLTRWGGVAQGIMLGAGMAIFNAVAGGVRSAVGQVGDAISKASDLGETISKTGVLFGENADQLVAWASQASTSIGQSQQSALDAATTFATFGRAAGLSGEDLVGFSTDFVTLASDLASFNNTTPEQAIEAIGAALRGEAEPLRAYGVLLDDASMRQAALKLGLIETTKEALTPQQKVLAAQALIYEQTSAAQGDFARTSEGLANQQRILTAQMDNLKTTIGQALLPAITPLVAWLNQMAQQYLPAVASFITERAIPAVTAFAGALGNLWGVVGPLLGAFFGQVGEWLGGFKAGLDGSATDADGWAGRLGTAAGTARDWLNTNFFGKLPGWWSDFKGGLDGSATNSETWAGKLGEWFGTAGRNLRTNLFDKLPGWWSDFKAGFAGNRTEAESWAGALGDVIGRTASVIAEDIGDIVAALEMLDGWFTTDGQKSATGWAEVILTVIEVVGKAFEFLTGVIKDLITAMAVLKLSWDVPIDELWNLASEVANRTSVTDFISELLKELQKRQQPPANPAQPPANPAPPEQGTGAAAAMAAAAAGTSAGNHWTINIVGTGNGAQDLIGAAQFLQAMYA